MRERDLEQLMVDFYHRRFNLLVCTTIIESGIDVPTANTIMITAPTAWAAQLHQLRGRVGRSTIVPTPTSIVPPRAALNADARNAWRRSNPWRSSAQDLCWHARPWRFAAQRAPGEQQKRPNTEVRACAYLDMLEQAVKALKDGREPALDRPLAADAESSCACPPSSRT